MSAALPAFTRNANDIVAEVLMTRTTFSGAVVLLEGPSDSRFFRRHLKPTLTQVVICGCKPVVLNAMIALATITGMYGCVGIVDRDYDDHLGSTPPSDVFQTDTHDVETMMLSKRLDRVIAELGEPDKLSAFQAAHGCSIERALLDRCDHFNRIRYLNEVSPAFKQSLDNVSPWKYTDITTWTVDGNQVINDFAGLCGITAADVVQHLLTVPALLNWRDTRGHDAMALLSAGLRQVLGAGKQVSESSLSLCLRLAFDETDFSTTALFAALKVWEQSSIGLPLLV